MVRRLLQGLDQVVSVLWIYRPEGTFAYALKERKGGGEREEGEMLLEMLPGPSKQTANTVQRLPTELKVQNPTCTHRPIFRREMTLREMIIITSP